VTNHHFISYINSWTITIKNHSLDNILIRQPTMLFVFVVSFLVFFLTSGGEAVYQEAKCAAIGGTCKDGSTVCWSGGFRCGYCPTQPNNILCCAPNWWCVSIFVIYFCLSYVWIYVLLSFVNLKSMFSRYPLVSFLNKIIFKK